MYVHAPEERLMGVRLDVEAIKKDFPTLRREVYDKPIVYLDSAASSQTPQPVLDAMEDYYDSYRSNTERGVYLIATEATDAYERARARIAAFVDAPPAGTVFTRNTTESINLVAYSWVRRRLGPDDALLTTEMEHHANLVPWIEASREVGFDLRVIPITDDGRIDLDAAEGLLSDGRVVFLAVTQQSNVLGTINDVADLTGRARAANSSCRVLLDGAQYVPHNSASFTQLGCDFLAFSGHKMLGPTGIGVLAAKPELLEEMPPFITGGSMIRDVTLESASWNDVPHKFEAGTMPIAEAIGLAAAVDYLEAIGMEEIRRHEKDLTGYALEALAGMDDITVHGPAEPEARGGTISFVMDGVHAHDVGTIIDREGVCVRVGHHCTKPLMRRLGVAATARASLYVYNDERDVDAFVASLDRVRGYFGPVPEAAVSSPPRGPETDPHGPGGPA
jgi:cysteine desulfurase / selenocysteine lyase